MGEVRPGETIADRFRVERVLGDGPSGVLAAAFDGEMRVALRVLPAPVSSDVILRADGMRKLDSEHLARVLEVGRLEGGSVFIVTEWAEGDDLAKVLAERGPLPAEEAAEIVLQACDGLAGGHRLNLLHGRLDPTKLVVATADDGSPHVKVLGFELGPYPIPGDPEAPIDGDIGWVPYAAPETLSSSRTVDPQADVWSLGAILYELVTKKVPFEGETVGEVLSAILTVPFVPLGSLRPDLPRSYVSVAERSLHHDLERRCQDVSEISAVLAAIAPKRARAIAARIELTLHGTLPSLQRIIRQEQRTEPPAGPIARTVSRPPPGLVKSTPPPAAEPEPSPDADSEPEPPAAAEKASDPPSSLSPRLVGGVALAVIAVGGALALRSTTPAPPTTPAPVPGSVGVTESTSASPDAGVDADEETAPVSSRRPAP